MSAKQPNLINYSSIQTSLNKLGATFNSAEIHGSLCGLLIDNRSAKEWLASTLDDIPSNNDLIAKEHLSHLNQLYQNTKQQLNDEDLSLELLLPTDDQELTLRLQALSHWCEGFLFGIGSISKLDEKNMHTDVKEFMTDLLGISQIDNDETSNDENENDYSEIVEYVRMGVIYMNELLNPVHTSNSIH